MPVVALTTSSVICEALADGLPVQHEGIVTRPRCPGQGKVSVRACLMRLPPWADRARLHRIYSANRPRRAATAVLWPTAAAARPARPHPGRRELPRGAWSLPATPGQQGGHGGRGEEQRQVGDGEMEQAHRGRGRASGGGRARSEER